MIEPTQFYYNEAVNLIYDEGGYTIFNIHQIVSPNMLFLFKAKKEDMFVYGLNGEPVELIYEGGNEID